MHRRRRVESAGGKSTQRLLLLQQPQLATPSSTPVLTASWQLPHIVLNQVGIVVASRPGPFANPEGPDLKAVLWVCPSLHWKNAWKGKGRIGVG